LFPLLSILSLFFYALSLFVHCSASRLFADLLENASFGLEMLTPAFPHPFVFIGAAAGAGCFATALIQAITYFYLLLHCHIYFLITFSLFFVWVPNCFYDANTI
jgi:hypothetical protein